MVAFDRSLPKLSRYTRGRVLSQGYRTGQIQCFRLLLSNSVEHLLFQSGIINTKFYAFNGSRDRSIWLLPRRTLAVRGRARVFLLFVEEEHLYAALACFFGLVAVESPDIALSLVGGRVMLRGGNFWGVRSRMAVMI